MSGHTPGPWRWVEFNERGDSRLAELWGAKEKVCDFGTCEQYYPTAGEEPSEEDKALISAAPDLLAACEAMLELLDLERVAHAAHGRGLVPARQAAREAIAKARGGA